MRQGRGGQRSKKSGCSRRGLSGSGNAGVSGNTNTGGSSVSLSATLVDDGIGNGSGGPAGSANSATAAVAAAAAAAVAAAASSWKTGGGSGNDPFSMGYSGGPGGSSNNGPYQQPGGHQSPSLFHQQQGSPAPGGSGSPYITGGGNSTPQLLHQQHYSPSTPSGGGSSTPVPYGCGTPNSQPLNGGAQMPFGSPSSVSSGGGGGGFGNSNPGSGPPPPQQSPFGSQQFYGGNVGGSMAPGSPFGGQQQIMNHHSGGPSGGMINAADTGPNGRMMVDHPSCFPSSMVGGGNTGSGRRVYGYGPGHHGNSVLGGPQGHLGGVHHSGPTGHHGGSPVGSAHHGGGGPSTTIHSGHHGTLPHNLPGTGLHHVPLHSHGGVGGPLHHPHGSAHHGGPGQQHSLPLHPSHAHHVPDYRVFELNKRLQNRNEDSDNVWWDQFATEFFEDDATLTLTFCLEDGPKRYSIGRTLIPRYFRSIFEGGVTDLYYHLRANATKESFHNTSLTLDCDHCTMVTTHLTSSNQVNIPGGGPSSAQSSGVGGQPTTLNNGISMQKNLLGSMPSPPVYTRVCTEGRLTLEFTYDDMMRIRTWHLAVRQHRELVPRSSAAAAVATIVMIHQQGSGCGNDRDLLSSGTQPPNAEIVHQQVAKNITRQGITNSTLNYLRLCVILEPMQELMSRHKAYSLSPRDCLKTTLFQKWQRMVAPPESQRPANKRRKRKGSNSGNAGGPQITQSGVGGSTSGPTASSKKRSPGPSGGGGAGFNLASQDVMVVGEPSLMGGEFGDEDERLITRLENTQYDAAAASAVNNATSSVIGGVAIGGPSSVGGNDIQHIISNSSGDQLFPQHDSSAPGTPTAISQSSNNSNGLQQQQNTWVTGPPSGSNSGVVPPPNGVQTGSNGSGQQNPNNNPGSGVSISGNNQGSGVGNLNSSDSISADKKSPASAASQQIGL